MTADSPATPGALPAVSRVRTWASFVRFEHTLFSLPLLLAGVFSVPGPALSAGRWALIAIAAVGARTAAMSLNRLIDRRLDALNPRTRTRELPAGRMRPAEAWGLLAASTGAYLAACVALDPVRLFYLQVAPIPLVVFTVYPYLKRFTSLCHLGVGTGLALSPLAGWAAAHPDLARPAPAIGLALFALFWVSGFDIIYATLDEEFDRAHGVRSLVVRLGRRRALGVSGALHALAFACLVLAVLDVASGGHAARGGAGTGPALAALVLAVAGALLWLEQKWAEDVNLAFFKVNVWVGLAAFLAVLAARLGA